MPFTPENFRNSRRTSFCTHTSHFTTTHPPLPRRLNHNPPFPRRLDPFAHLIVCSSISQAYHHSRHHCDRTSRSDHYSHHPQHPKATQEKHTKQRQPTMCFTAIFVCPSCKCRSALEETASCQQTPCVGAVSIMMLMEGRHFGDEWRCGTPGCGYSQTARDRVRIWVERVLEAQQRGERGDEDGKCLFSSFFFTSPTSLFCGVL